MAISDTIQAIAEQVDKEANDPNIPLGPDKVRSATARKLHKLATAAILGGPEDWVAYMKQFATTDAELARLIPTDGDTDDERRTARAYLVANGMCTDTSTGNLAMKVGKTLNLPEA